MNITADFRETKQKSNFCLLNESKFHLTWLKVIFLVIIFFVNLGVLKWKWLHFLVGMINILHGLGLRFLALGHHTPFMVTNLFLIYLIWICPKMFHRNKQKQWPLLSDVHSTLAWHTTTGTSARPSRPWGIVVMRFPWVSCPDPLAPSPFASLEQEMSPRCTNVQFSLNIQTSRMRLKAAEAKRKSLIFIFTFILYFVFL